MRDLTAVFFPIIGQLVWSPQAGFGTFLTLEFGEPHIVIREPISPSQETSPNVQRILTRRRVSIVGQWHLWLQHCQWEITTRNNQISSTQLHERAVASCLEELSGQRLIGVKGEFGSPLEFRLVFDLGGELHVVPAGEASDEQWTLFVRGSRLAVSGKVREGIVFEEKNGDVSSLPS